MFERRFVGAIVASLALVSVACGSSAPDGAEAGSPSGASSGSNSGGGASGGSGSPAPSADASTGTPSGGSSGSSGGASSSGSGSDAGIGTSGGDAAAPQSDGGTGSTPGADASAPDAPGISVSATCKIPTWPTPVGSTVNISGTKQISGVYDGKMALHEGNLNDCTTGDQSSTTPIMQVADGGTVKNVIFSAHIGDGIHCLGSCTIDNVWYNYICDDAATMLGGAGKTMTVQNSGFRGARDKIIQHNGGGSTVVINNVYAEVGGKLYRSCGIGCTSSAKRMARISNVVAIGVSQVAGVSTNDSVTLSNICAYRTDTLCKTYLPGTDTASTVSANGTPEGPGPNCTYTGTDSHALINDVSGSFQTDVLCPGPNAVKFGTTNATACVPGFQTCLRACTPGSYGFRQVNCPAATYASNGPCAPAADPTIAAHLGSANAATATTVVTNNAPCTTEWAWANDGAGKYCVCVMKPGYYQASSAWTVWDCQSQWW